MLLRKRFKSNNTEAPNNTHAAFVPSISTNIVHEDLQNHYEPPPYIDIFDTENAYACWGTPYSPPDEHIYQELTTNHVISDNGSNEYLQIELED